MWLTVHLPQNGAQPKVPRYRPAVKFRKISKDTLEKLQNVEDTNSKDANSEDDIDDADDGNPNSADVPQASSTPKSSLGFRIDSDIDINSAALLDMISEEEVVSDKALHTQPTTFGLPVAPTAARSLTVEEVFAMWDY